MRARRLQLEPLQEDFNLIAEDRRAEYDRIRTIVLTLEETFEFLTDGTLLEPEDATVQNYNAYKERMAKLAREIQAQLPNAAAAKKNIIEAEAREGGMMEVADAMSLLARLANAARERILPEHHHLFQGDYQTILGSFLAGNQGVLKTVRALANGDKELEQ